MDQSNVLGSLLVRFAADSKPFEDGMKTMETRLTGFQSTAVSVGASLATALPFAALGGEAIHAAEKFETAFRTISNRTGETGEAFHGLEESLKKVYANSAAPLDQISEALSAVHSRTNLTGEGLEKLTSKMLQLAKVSNTDVVPLTGLVTRMFGDWSISTDKQARSMDYLLKASQQTGVSVATLAEQVVYVGAPMRQLGLSFEQTVALIAKFQKEGVNTELVLGGMKAALNKLAKEGVADTGQAFKDLVEKIKSADEAHGRLLAVQFAGQKRAADFFAAIKEGRLDIDQMVKSINKATDEGDRHANSIGNWSKTWEIFKHNLELALLPLGEPLLSAFANALKAMTPIVQEMGKVGEMFTNLPAAVQYTVIALVGLPPMFRLVATGIDLLSKAYIGLGFAQAASGLLAAPLIFRNIATAVSLGMVPALTTGETILLRFGQGAILAAAAFAGWKLGEWLRNNIPLMQRFGDTMGEWISRVPGFQLLVNRLNGVSEANKNLAAVIAITEAKLRAKGIVVDKTGLSLEQYAKKLQEAAIAHSVTAVATDKHTASNVVHGKTLDDITDKTNKHKKSVDALAEALSALGVSDGAYKTAQKLAPAYALVQDAFHKAKISALEYFEASERMAQAQFDAEHGGEKLTIAMIGVENQIYRLLQPLRDSAEAMRKQGLEQIEVHQSSYDLSLVFGEMLNRVQNLKRGTDALNEAMAELGQQIRPAVELMDRVHEAGIKTQEDLDEAARKARELWDAMRESGMFAYRDLLEAEMKYLEVTDRANGLTEEQRRRLEELRKVLGVVSTSVKQVATVWDELKRVGQRTLDELSGGLARVIVEGGKLGDVLKRVAIDSAEAILQILIKKALMKLVDVLGDVLSRLGGIGKAIGGIIGSAGGAAGSAAGEAAGSAAGQAGGIAGTAGSAGSAAASGVAGAINMVSGIVGAVGSVATAVITGMTAFHANTLLARIEESTRAVKIDTTEGADSIYAKTKETYQQMLNVVARLVELRAALFDPVAANLERIEQAIVLGCRSVVTALGVKNGPSAQAVSAAAEPAQSAGSQTSTSAQSTGASTAPIFAQSTGTAALALNALATSAQSMGVSAQALTSAAEVAQSIGTSAMALTAASTAAQSQASVATRLNAAARAAAPGGPTTVQNTFVLPENTDVRSLAEQIMRLMKQSSYMFQAGTI
jgi:hypothetical protein